MRIQNYDIIQDFHNNGDIVTKSTIVITGMQSFNIFRRNNSNVEPLTLQELKYF